MNYDSFFEWIEFTYRIDINKELRDTIIEHFGDNLNIYTEQDLYEQSRKIIQNNKYKYIKNKYYNY